ncbi:MAG: hypothetical protein RL885_13575 [Planctomycetota bacterium]
MAKKTGRTTPGEGFGDLSIAVSGSHKAPREEVTARVAGELVDLALPVSPTEVEIKRALQGMAKAINLALQSSFVETELEPAYEAARVHKGTVEILHREYIGLGDGVFATIGKLAKSFTLTLKGPDPVAPQERRGKGGAVSGLYDLLARKLNLVQEYEDMVPTFVEQMLDRLEAVRTIVGWRRDEWHIETKVIGLDVVLTPVTEESGPSRTKHKSTKRGK